MGRELSVRMCPPIFRSVFEEWNALVVQERVGREVFDLLRVQISQASFCKHRVGFTEEVWMSKKILLDGKVD